MTIAWPGGDTKSPFGPFSFLKGKFLTDMSSPGRHFSVRQGTGVSTSVVFRQGAARFTNEDGGRSGFLFPTPTPQTIAAATAPPDPGVILAGVNIDMRIKAKIIAVDDRTVVSFLFGTDANATGDRPYSDCYLFSFYEATDNYRILRFINAAGVVLAASATFTSPILQVGDLCYLRGTRNGSLLTAEVHNLRSGDKARLTATDTSFENIRLACSIGVGFTGGSGTLTYGTFDLLAVDIRYSG